MKNEFYWRISVFGIPVPVKLFMGKEKKDGHRKAAKGKKTSEKAVNDGKAVQEEKKQKKGALETVQLVLELVKQLMRDLPKAFRIRLCSLDVTVGGKEAADIAINYGRLYALIEGTLALLYSYKSVLYGFFANRKKIRLSTDYHSTKTRAKFKLRISFFLWQLLFVAIRVGVRYIVLTLKSARDDADTDVKVKEKTDKQL